MIMKSAIKIVKTLQDKGFQAVFAGGCVRDLIMGLQSSDIDIATNATPEVVESLFEKTVSVGKAFGVIVVILDGEEFEIATFREDGLYSDNRRPDSVTFGTMEADAIRRDLTVNGMFYDPIKEEFYDFVNGRQDIEDKVIRFIGDPEKRIEEDKLRILRAVRFALKFGFSFESKTYEAIKAHAPEIQKVSIERISEEFLKLLRLRKFRATFDLLFQTNLIDYVMPEIRTMEGVEQPVDFHPEGDVLTHTILALEALPADASDELMMGVLLHDVGKPVSFRIAERIRFDGHDEAGAKIAEVILRRMKFSNEFIDRVVALVSKHMKFMCVKQMRLSTFKKFISLPYFEDHMAVHRVDCLSSHGSLENLEFVIKKRSEIPVEKVRPARLVTGVDLLAMGFIQGPRFKTILEDVEDRQLEDMIKDREAALEYVKATFVS